MTDVATVGVHDVATARSSAAPLVHASRAGYRPRTMRALIQVACLGAVALAVRTHLPVVEVLVVAQLVAGAVALTAYSRPARAPRPRRGPCGCGASVPWSAWSRSLV